MSPGLPRGLWLGLLLAAAGGGCHPHASGNSKAEEGAVARSGPSSADGGFEADGGDPDFPPVVEEATLDPKHLEAAVRTLAVEAAARHKRVFLYFGATWCGPCRLLKTAFERANNRSTFAPWVLARVNVDDLPPGPVLGVDFDEIPFFIKLDSHGKPAGTLKGRAIGKVTSPASVDASLKRFLGS